MVGLGVRRAGLVAAVLLLALGSPVPGHAASGVAVEPACARPERIFAVRGTDGHLVELTACPESIVEVGEVDAGDWRAARQVIATGDGTVTVVYTLTGDGRLEARRQDAPGATLGAPVEVGADVDWSRFRSVVVPRRGFLWADGLDVRAFRHVGWDSGGTGVVEGPVVFPSRSGRPALGELTLTGMDGAGRAEAVYLTSHMRVWRGRFGDAVAYANGALPGSGLTGVGYALYTVAFGDVARLHHPADKDHDSSCVVNSNRWQVRARLPGDWSLVVAPQRDAANTDGWPVVTAWPSSGAGNCPDDVTPYEWQ